MQGLCVEVHDATFEACPYSCDKRIAVVSLSFGSPHLATVSLCCVECWVCERLQTDTRLVRCPCHVHCRWSVTSAALDYTSPAALRSELQPPDYATTITQVGPQGSADSCKTSHSSKHQRHLLH
jgi:hypothetical protein